MAEIEPSPEIKEKERIARLGRLVDGVVGRLGEEFESVQIFCSNTYNNKRGEAERFEMGKGSYYTRVGQVTVWLEAEREGWRNRHT